MKKILLLVCSLAGITLHANISNIDFSKVTKDKVLLAELDYIKANQQYYDHWSPEWHYDVTKESLVQKLESAYTGIQSKGKKGTEFDLLMGDLSHFLYNLETEKYHGLALGHYNAAIKSAPKDYRGYWFLGNHYALAAVEDEGINYFLKAEKLLPKTVPADFWVEYTYASHLANMPSHTLYAMAMEKEITGKTGHFEQELGMAVQKNIKLLDASKEYKPEDIWNMTEDDTLTFTCRPMGMSVAVDSTWGFDVKGYQNGRSAFLVFPPKLKGKQNFEIGYTLALFTKNADDNSNLEEFVVSFAEGYEQKNKIQLTSKYPGVVAYEILDKKTYANMGGAHLYIVGIEREAPDYPGMLLEKPARMPRNEEGGLQYYNPVEHKDRIANRIFYVFMLDSCEDINAQSLANFKNFIENQVVIE